jgi:hypothetical protein
MPEMFQEAVIIKHQTVVNVTVSEPICRKKMKCPPFCMVVQFRPIERDDIIHFQMKLLYFSFFLNIMYIKKKYTYELVLVTAFTQSSIKLIMLVFTTTSMEPGFNWSMDAKQLRHHNEIHFHQYIPSISN